MEENDDVIIGLVRQKNEEAYDFLYKRYYKIIRFWISQYKTMLKANRIEQEDVLSIMMAKFPIYLDEYDSNFGIFRIYMKMVTEREVYKVVRDANRNSYKALTTAYSLDQQVNEDDSGLTYSGVISSNYYINEFGNRYDSEILQENVKECLNNQKEIEQKVYRLYIQNKSLKYIAEQLGIEVKKVDNIVFRIKKKLEKYK